MTGQPGAGDGAPDDRDGARALAAAREALAGDEAWLVGGAIRDRLLDRPTADLDVVTALPPGEAARAIARSARGTAFELSEAFGAWRVAGPRGRWRIDVAALRGGDLDADLHLRDFTLNAIAEPIGGGALVDPTGGVADLRAGRLRMIAPAAFDDDPLRALRLARLACELELEPEAATVAAARDRAPALTGVSVERMFAELKRIVAADGVLAGLALVERLGLEPVVLPEFARLRDVHLRHGTDVASHSLSVLEELIGIQRDPAALLGAERGMAVAAQLALPLGDELSRGDGLRLGALLHDAGKPGTLHVEPDGRLRFPDHETTGARVARAALARLRASERVGDLVGRVVQHHRDLARLGRDWPPSRRAVFGYLVAGEPVAVEVTLLSAADRLASRERRGEEATARHLDHVRAMLDEALAHRAAGAPAPLVRGDALAEAVGRPPGPWLGEVLAELAAARFANEIESRQEAIEHARAFMRRR